jgi:MarR family transcriptional regulator, organic hydroperoxide resistance regulator
VKTRGITNTSIPPARGAPNLAFAGNADLTWLLHRAAQRMRGALDDVARTHGLAGARDWLVLSAIAAGPPQTQLALAHALGLDKTTLTSLLDRLEARGFVTRSLDSHDRRARIPSLTSPGLEVQRQVARARDETEAAVLGEFTDSERQLLRDLLIRLSADAGGPGSCI